MVTKEKIGNGIGYLANMDNRIRGGYIDGSIGSSNVQGVGVNDRSILYRFRLAKMYVKKSL